MSKQNCWEFKKCGREENGEKADQLGVCPAYATKKLNKINSGKNAGRSCWAVAGTLCGGKVQGTYAAKISNCLECEFYKLVQNEEGTKKIMTTEIIKILNS